jgi:hypothetical protein
MVLHPGHEGWTGDPNPSRYTFVCEGKVHRLSRPVTAERLRQLYDAAVIDGIGEIVLR